MSQHTARVEHLLFGGTMEKVIVYKPKESNMTDAERIKDLELMVEIGHEMANRFDIIIKGLDQLRAENLIMREALERLDSFCPHCKPDASGAYCPCTSGMFWIIKKGLEAPHTAFLAEKMRLMEKIVDSVKKYDNSYRTDEALKDLDAHLETEKR